MIRTLLTAIALSVAMIFIVGCYVGIRMTINVVDVVDAHRKKKST